MTHEEIEQKRKEKNERLKSLLPSSIQIPLLTEHEDVARSKIKLTDETEILHVQPRISYKFNLRSSDREWLRDYCYTQSQKYGRLYTYTEAIDDAIAALRKSINYNILKKPL